MTKDEMITALQSEVKSLSIKLGADDYSNACDDAARDTGWDFPVSGSTKIYWQKQRAVRHIFFYLLTESTRKFKVKQYSLNQSFEHYLKIIEYMDTKWEAYLLEPDADDTYELFGHKIDAGFQYVPRTGKDTTYTKYNKVIVKPDESS